MSDFFWSDSIWLSPGIKWTDLEKFQNDGGKIPVFEDLYIIFPLSIAILVLRKTLEKIVFKPIGRHFGLKDRTRKTNVPNEILEKYFSKSKNLKEEDKARLLEKLGGSWDEGKIERWFRNQRRLTIKPKIGKFGETMWRAVYYIFAFSYGTSVVINKSWFWNTIECWENYPMQELTPDVQKYYFLGCGHALSLCLTLLTDNVRKDFKAKIVHHAATLSLLVFSYVCGYTRVGALVMWLHDGSDFYLEIAKSLVYLKKQFLADIFFTIFALAFFISRIVYFPFVVIHTTLVKPIGLFGLFPGYFIFNALLGTLLCLHLYWFYLICDLAWKLIKGDQIADNRSDNEESSSEDEAKKTK